MKGVRQARVPMSYEPFIDDPEHIRALDRQRFVVLRPAVVVAECHRQVQDVLRRLLDGLPVSFPARAHVTLAGFAAGTPVESVQDLIAGWVRDAPALRITVERATSFPAPFQIAVLQVLKTPALFAALESLRRKAEQRGLAISTTIPAEEWVFHISLAYCANVTAAEWAGFAQFIETLQVPKVSAAQETVEIVAFDEGREHSGGMHLLPREGSVS